MDRWECVLTTIAGLLTDGRRTVAVDGYQDTELFAERLSGALNDGGRVTTGPDESADVTIWLRTAPVEQHRSHRRDAADVVVDLHDVQWPVIRFIRPEWADRESWYLREIQAFFAARATTWNRRFGDDLPAYAEAVDSIGIEPGAVVADVGCGTGRALVPLREAVGANGVVLGLDVTPQMLVTATDAAKQARAGLAVADARRLPLRDAVLDVAFTAGLITHLPDVVAGLAELGRVTRPGGRLALFHPSGRIALAARHGRTVMPGEPLDERPLRASLAAAGWELDFYDDPPNRFLALATNRLR